ncbi:hypothetical protein RCH06_003598 [Polaromonas sp. CG_9.5]|nr:hypothetical protein [Polaromonas sp. CG_9.5]
MLSKSASPSPTQRRDGEGLHYLQVKDSALQLSAGGRRVPARLTGARQPSSLVPNDQQGKKLWVPSRSSH